MLQSFTKLALVFLLAFSSLNAFSQDTSPVKQAVAANNLLQEAYNFTDKLYYNTIETSASIYKGEEYVFYSFRIDGDPFFYSEESDFGDIRYGGILYKNIEYRYDIYLKKLVVAHNKLSYNICIDTAMVDYFKLHNHQFYKLEADSSETIKHGFYDMLVDGDAKLYAKRSKSLQKEIENQQIHEWFDIEDKYYLFKDGVYYKVKKKGSLLKVLKNKKKALKSHIKSEGIKFKKSPENGLIQTVNYYNKLLQQ
ncbi:hypothetical protein [Chondrinema litorale]|uniref:hypothetical protein n=1 Tax=Chondrinema litorale TaxID=2994555 RepID=UPI0025432A84|nr:hypothetical protein [Chondrinema litorale]UZR97241.1 hypothetical protein OQ292_25410 [Chondrinema litorale]